MATLMLSLMEGELLYLRIVSGKCATWQNKHTKRVAVAHDAFLSLSLQHMVTKVAPDRQMPQKYLEVQYNSASKSDNKMAATPAFLL